MKKIASLLLFAAISIHSFSQAPLAFKYQAVARDASGEVLKNTTINLKFAIMEDGVNGTEMYAESFSRTTNNFGLFSVEIGKGTLLSGSLANIPWGEHTYFLKTWVNDEEVGASQLLSVPYALFAGSTAGDFSGSFNDLDDVPGGLDDGDDNTQLTEIEVDSMVSDNGYLIAETDPAFTAWDKSYNDLSELPDIVDTVLMVIDTSTLIPRSYSDLNAKPSITDTIEAVLDTTTKFVRKDEPFTGSFYRWATWSTFNQIGYWYANNDSKLFGGVNPQQWGDGGGMAYQMSSVKDDLLTLFNKKGYAGKNANVWAEEWISYSSTNSRHAGALFRINNTSMEDIEWTVNWYGTAYGGWNERASIAANGANTWNSGGSMYGANSKRTIVLTIPANRVSTIIFIASSTATSGNSRGCFLGFTDDCLVLPEGLEYVDDLNTAQDGWEY